MAIECIARGKRHKLATLNLQGELRRRKSKEVKMWLNSGCDFLNWMQISLTWRSALCRQQQSSFHQLQVPTHLTILSGY
jgi:hypothetical protein